jgi:hypothetical protein
MLYSSYGATAYVTGGTSVGLTDGPTQAFLVRVCVKRVI